MRIEKNVKKDKLYIQHDEKLYKVLKISTNNSYITYLINKKYKCYDELFGKWKDIKIKTWINGGEHE